MARFPMHTFQQDAILARLSQALVALEVSNVKSLTSEQCEKLQCGDVVVKKDASGEHSYVVTFKSSTGMCLTYMDASVVETQSYDKVGDNWVYNSEDKTDIIHPKLENIKDKDGHNRFIEGDITIETISGVTQTYGKWALSGSHLLIVLAIDIANGTEITGGILTTIESLPKWIKDKVVPLYATTIVTNQQFQAYGDDYSAQNIGVSLQKSTYLYLYSGSFTATKDRHCRISYDLLIDNE